MINGHLLWKAYSGRKIVTAAFYVSIIYRKATIESFINILNFYANTVCKLKKVNFDGTLVQWFLIGGPQRMIEVLEIVAMFLGVLKHFFIRKP